MRLDKHNQHCKEIVNTMEQYYYNLIYRYNDDLLDISDYEVLEDDNGSHILLDGEKAYLDDMEQLSLYSYFEDVLDIEYVVDYQKNYKAVNLLVAFGGPNIYINTNNGKVELFWWNETGSADIPQELVNEIDFIFEDMYNAS